MAMTRAGRLGTAALLIVMQGCMRPIPPPPMAGYGDPYKGNGQPIYVKDSRDDWTINEGKERLTSEQALEASGDAEYEARRQMMKDYNVKLYREGLAHQTRGRMMMLAGIAIAVGGYFGFKILARNSVETTTMPATDTMPEMRTSEPTGGAKGYALLGTLSIYAGLLTVLYGGYGGSRPPPYQEWHTPAALDRPAYVRQSTEAYNEKIGAPGVSDAPGFTETPTQLAPGQRKPPAPRPTQGGQP
jgi:hypothetical protein